MWGVQIRGFEGTSRGVSILEGSQRVFCRFLGGSNEGFFQKKKRCLKRLFWWFVLVKGIFVLRDFKRVRLRKSLGFLGRIL